MDVGRVGSLFIRAVESFLEGNAIRLTLTFKEPIDLVRLTASFQQLVAHYRTLQLRFEDRGWSSMTPAEVQTHLDRQAVELTAANNPKDIYRKFHATNSRLPVEIHAIDDCRLVFSLNHVFGNGKSALYYVEDLLRTYGNENAGATPVQKSETSLAHRGANAVRGLFWLIAYLMSFAWRAGRDAGRVTVDLSKGKKPETQRDGYAEWTYLLTAEETERVLKRSGVAALTVTESLCLAMATALLDAQPEKSRVCISVPTDLGTHVTAFSPDKPGNYTGALIVQLWRNQPLDVQVRRAFGWARRGVHYWTPWLMGRLPRGYAKLRDHFLRQALRPMPQRAPFENFSCAVSSVGVVQGPMAQKYLTAVSAHTRTQTILLCAITLNGRMSIEVSVSRDLFDCAEVAAVTDRAMALFTGMPALETAGKRIALAGHDFGEAENLSAS